MQKVRCQVSRIRAHRKSALSSQGRQSAGLGVESSLPPPPRASQQDHSSPVQVADKGLYCGPVDWGQTGQELSVPGDLFFLILNLWVGGDRSGQDRPPLPHNHLSIPTLWLFCLSPQGTVLPDASGSVLPGTQELPAMYGVATGRRNRKEAQDWRLFTGACLAQVHNGKG